MIAGTLAHVDELRVSRNHGQHTLAYEGIIDHDIGFGEDFLSFQREKTGIAGACAHQPDFSYGSLLLFFPIILAKLDGKIPAQGLCPLRIAFYRALLIAAGLLVVIKPHEKKFAVLDSRMGRHR